MENRLPRKGDKVRFWELCGGVRTQVTGVIAYRELGNLTLSIDGCEGCEKNAHSHITPTRKMEIL